MAVQVHGGHVCAVNVCKPARSTSSTGRVSDQPYPAWDTGCQRHITLLMNCSHAYIIMLDTAVLPSVVLYCNMNVLLSSVYKFSQRTETNTLTNRSLIRMEYSDEVQHLNRQVLTRTKCIMLVSTTFKNSNLTLHSRLGLYMGKMWIFICGLTLEYR